MSDLVAQQMCATMDRLEARAKRADADLDRVAAALRELQVHDERMVVTEAEVLELVMRVEPGARQNARAALASLGEKKVSEVMIAALDDITIDQETDEKK